MSGSIGESLAAGGQLKSTLRAGTDQLSGQQSITFTKYIQTILPLDGFLFWVNAALLSTAYGGTALGNASQGDMSLAGAPWTPGQPVTITVEGSFHYDIERRQDEDQTIDVNRCIFTAFQPISDLDEMADNVLWIGSFEDPRGSEGVVRFAFSRRQNFYQQADLFHYVGDAIYPDMETQIIDSMVGFDLSDVVVSNSLPIWLAMDQMNPPFPFPARQQVPLYPSFLVSDNILPPYIAVHIPPESTQAISSAPLFNSTHSQVQFVKDRVELTFVGLRNRQILDFQAYVQWLTEQYEPNFGVMNIPVPRDEKRKQTELSAIAMKKTMVYEVNYYQSRVRNIAQALILSVIPSYIIGD